MLKTRQLSVSQALEKAYIRYRDFIARHRNESSVFALTFILALTSIRVPDAGNTIDNVEQWINITNETLFGQRDVLFSYGPLYWLTGQRVTPYNIYSYWVTLVTLSALNALFWSIMFSMSYRARAVILFAIPCALFFDGLIFSATFMVWPLTLIAYLEHSRHAPLSLGHRSWFVLGCLVSLCFYIRFFFGLIGMATLTLYWLSCFLGHRRSWAILAFYAGILTGYVLLGLLIFNNASSLVDYIKINHQLSFGNSVDMTYDVINSKRSFQAIGIIWLGFNVFLLLNRRVLLLPMNFMLLLLFKLGFSRTDHYLSYYVSPVAALSLLMLFDRSKLGRGLFLIVTACLFYLAAVPGFPGARLLNKIAPPIDFKISYADRMQQAYASFKLDSSIIQEINHSSIDVYPYNNEYLLANELNYHHRPIFQNYMTLTPALDVRNQHFFETAERPAFVLWTAGVNCRNADCNVFDGFDSKYTLNEDPLTSSTILLNYHVAGLANGRNATPVALLKANASVTNYALTQLSTTSMELGKWYPVPQHATGVIKLLPKFEFTALGKLKNLLFRGSVVEISYRMMSGDVRQYRLNLLNAGSGIWISPLLDGFDFKGEAVESIMLTSKMPGYIKPAFAATWAILPIDAVSTRPPRYNPVVTPVVQDEIELPCLASVDVANGISPLPASINAQRALYLRGWLARSTDDGTLFEQTLLTLTDANGIRTLISTAPEQRPDVATVFKHPGLADAGFESALDLTGYKGTYRLGLAAVSGSHLYLCTQPSIALTIP